MLQLPGLDHLSISNVSFNGARGSFPTAIVEQLQQLTYRQVEVDHMALQGPYEASFGASNALQPLHALTRLAVLRLSPFGGDRYKVTASMLSGMHHLTRLELKYCYTGPSVLEGKTLLQHLELWRIFMPHGQQVSQLLSQLEPLQQLTHLRFDHKWWAIQRGAPSPTAYSALTANSSLQHLSINGCSLTKVAWEHIFGDDRKLMQLKELDFSTLDDPEEQEEVCSGPEGSSLVHCCPGLQRLNLIGLVCDNGMLAALQGLSKLHKLELSLYQPISNPHWSLDATICFSGATSFLDVPGMAN
jgi:hypothetical protein